jgi:hypothetical protein
MTTIQTWELVHSPIATDQGWDIFDAGCDFPEWQVQAFDADDVLIDDTDAWEMVMAGACPTTRYARRFIAEHSHVEFARMLSYVNGWPL